MCAEITYTKIVLNPGDNLGAVFAQIKDENIHVIFQQGLYFSGGTQLDCLMLRGEHVILEGEGEVVIYDNRGHMINAHPYPNQMSTLAYTILIDARTVQISNVTFVNGCNIDFQYGDIFLPKVSGTITQAYAFGGWNIDQLDIDNSKFYSILDTFSLKNVKAVNISNSYIQGNNDFIAVGEKTYYYRCRFRNMGPFPMWAAMDGYMIFDECTFTLDGDVEMLSFTKRGGNMAFLNSCIFGKAKKLQMEIEPRRESRYYLYQTTYNKRKAEFEGFSESFVDLTDDQYLMVHNRQFDTLRLKLSGSRIVEDETVLELSAVPDRVEASEQIQCEIRRNRNQNELIVRSNIIGKDQEAYLDIYAGFLRQRVYLTAVGKKVLNPVILKELSYRIENGKLQVDYEVAHPENVLDLSYVVIYQEDFCLYRVSRDDSVDILKTDVGKAFCLTLHARTEETKEYIAEPLFTRPICKSDVSTDIIMDDLRCYDLGEQNHFYMDKSEFTYKGDEVSDFVKFDFTDSRPFTYTYGTDGAKGIQGLLYTGRGACLIYPIAEWLHGLELDIDFAVEKTAGSGFGSANGQFLELFMNYNHETQSGIALRIEREASAADGVYLSVRSYENGVNRIVGGKKFTRRYRTYCRLSAKWEGQQMEFALSHKGEKDSFKVGCRECVSSFMVRSSGSEGVGNRFLILRLEYHIHSGRT